MSFKYLKPGNLKKKFLEEKNIWLYLFFYLLFLLVLSFLRDAVGDETYYLRETYLISELFKEGIWLGNYGVGLHGVLFKIPVALIYLVQGKPSVWVATLFTISISITTLYLFYKILIENFLNKKFAFLATVLFSITLYFINTSVSFNRDIPAIFTVILFLHLFFKKTDKVWIGLTFLLMLDAKEHVFLTVAPLYMIYLLIEYIRSLRGKEFLEKTGKFIKESIIVYILPLVWIILMFTTSLVPVNMFIASIGNVVKVEKNWISSQFSTSVASANLLGGESREIPKSNEVFRTNCNNNYHIQNVDSKEEGRTPEFICNTLELIDLSLSYVGKILYPRTFSFISVPKIIVLPAVVISIKKFFEWWKKKDKRYLLPIILIFNILIVIFRASHGRYLLPASPLFALFFVLFIKDFYRDIRFSRNVLIATTVFVITGLFFESTYIIPKILLESALLSVFWGLYSLRKNHKIVKNMLKILIVIVLSLGMSSTYIAFSYSIGQIGQYIKYGYNKETKEIASHLQGDEKIWVNEYTSIDLLRLYRNEIYIEPEWNWQLKDWIPKSALLKTYSEKTTFEFPIENISNFKSRIIENNIEKVIVIKSEKEEFLYQEYVEVFNKQEWLQLENSIELKNKVMYIFDVQN